MSTRTQIYHSNVVPLYKDVVATNRVFMAVLEIVSRVANQAQICSVLVHQTRRIDLVVGHWCFPNSVWEGQNDWIGDSSERSLWKLALIILSCCRLSKFFEDQRTFVWTNQYFAYQTKYKQLLLVWIWIYAYAWFEIGYHKPRNYSKKLLKLSIACYNENTR